jgi:hypothetical protein
MTWLISSPNLIVREDTGLMDVADLVPRARKESVCALFAVS